MKCWLILEQTLNNRVTLRQICFCHFVHSSRSRKTESTTSECTASLHKLQTSNELLYSFVQTKCRKDVFPGLIVATVTPVFFSTGSETVETVKAGKTSFWTSFLSEQRNERVKLSTNAVWTFLVQTSKLCYPNLCQMQIKNILWKLSNCHSDDTPLFVPVWQKSLKWSAAFNANCSYKTQLACN